MDAVIDLHRLIPGWRDCTRLMTAGGLAVELETKLLKPPDDVAVLEAGEPPHQVLMISG